jgi:hypothetical protein
LICGEPWTKLPSEVGELTDWQIWNLLIRPAVRRSRAARGKRKRRKGPDPLPNRDEFIAGGLHFGGTAEHWAKAYDEWAASEEGQRELAKGGAPDGDTR